MRNAILLAALMTAACSSPGGSGTGPSCPPLPKPSCPAIGDDLGIGGGVSWSVEVDVPPPTGNTGYAYADFAVYGFDDAGAVYAAASVAGNHAPSVSPPCFSGIVQPLHQVDGRALFRVGSQQDVTLVSVPTAFGVYAIDSSGALYGSAFGARTFEKIGVDGAPLWTQPGFGDQVLVGVTSSVMAACNYGPSGGADCVALAAADGALLWHHTLSKPITNCGECATGTIYGVAVLPDGAVALGGVSGSDAPYDFGEGPVTGAFLAIYEPSGQLRAQKEFSGVGYFPRSDGVGKLVLYPNSPWLPGEEGMRIVDARGETLGVLGLDAAGTSIVRTDALDETVWSRPLPGGALAHGGSAGNEWEALGVDVAANHLALGRVEGQLVTLDLDTGSTERELDLMIPFVPGVLQDPPLQGGLTPTVDADGSLVAVAYAARGPRKPNPVMQAFLFGLPPLACGP